MTKEVLTLALEALKLSDTVFYPQTKIAIAAIERAIVNHIEDNLAMVAQPTPAEYAMGYAEGFNDGCKPKQEQGEPVAWMDKDGDIYKELPNEYWNPPHTPVYTKREWVGLTNEEFDFLVPYCHNEFDLNDYKEFARDIEAKLKEKNT
jgi:hypothetical protein